MNQVRTSYDAVAVDYASSRGVGEQVAGEPLLRQFAEQVDGPVLDAGCGPGQLTANLCALGLDVSGVDLSPGMVAVGGRRTRRCGSRWAP